MIPSFFKADFLWVIQDVSFSIARGEAVGIIGFNGAGKTTLVKLICGISAPSYGVVSVEGKVMPLISMEGCLCNFLTARENIKFLMAFYNIPKAMKGAIFDAIVDFSGLKDSLERPVEKFSSGMRSRLAFSVAVNIPADILLVDEALSVSDGAFQEKCLDKLLELKKENKTILLISHHMSDIEKISKRVMWLEKGKLVREGPTQEVIASYNETSHLKMRGLV